MSPDGWSTCYLSLFNFLSRNVERKSVPVVFFFYHIILQHVRSYGDAYERQSCFRKDDADLQFDNWSAQSLLPLFVLDQFQLAVHFDFFAFGSALLRQLLDVVTQ